MITFVGAYHGQTTGSARSPATPHRPDHRQRRRDEGALPLLLPLSVGPQPARRLRARVPRLPRGLRARQRVAGRRHGGDPPGGHAVRRRRRAAPPRFLRALRDLCDRHGIWLVFDEVKVGLGRSGTMWAFEQSGITPDAVARASLWAAACPCRRSWGGGSCSTSTSTTSTRSAAPPCRARPVSPHRCAGPGPAAGQRGRRGRQFLDGCEACTHAPVHRRRPRHGPHARLRTGRGPGEQAAPTEAHRLVYRCFELGLILIYCGLLANVIEMTPPLTISATRTPRRWRSSTMR